MERDTIFCLDQFFTPIIWSPVTQSVQHIAQDFTRVFGLCRGVKIDESSNTAHRGLFEDGVLMDPSF